MGALVLKKFITTMFYLKKKKFITTVNELFITLQSVFCGKYLENLLTLIVFVI